MKLVGGTVFQAEGTACAKTLRHPQLLWEEWEAQCGRSQVGRDRVVVRGLGRSGGARPRMSSQNMEGTGVYLKHDKKPLEDFTEKQDGLIYSLEKSRWLLWSHQGHHLPSSLLQKPTIPQNVHPWGLCAFLFRCLMTEWICQWMVLVVQILATQGQESNVIPYSLNSFLIKSIWTCYRPADTLSTESPPKYLWKRNSSFHFVSNGEIRKIFLHFSHDQSVMEEEWEPVLPDP